MYQTGSLGLYSQFVGNEPQSKLMAYLIQELATLRHIDHCKFFSAVLQLAVCCFDRDQSQRIWQMVAMGYSTVTRNDWNLWVELNFNPIPLPGPCLCRSGIGSSPVVNSVGVLGTDTHNVFV